MRSWRAQLPSIISAEFLGYIHTPAVGPAVFEPGFQLLASVRVEDIYVEFSLFGQSRHGEVAASKVADNGIDWVGAVHQIELRMERMAQEEFHLHLFGSKLMGKWRKPSSSSRVG